MCSIQTPIDNIFFGYALPNLPFEKYMRFNQQGDNTPSKITFQHAIISLPEIKRRRDSINITFSPLHLVACLHSSAEAD